MNTKKYHIVGIVPASIGRIIERGKINNSNTQAHSIAWLGTGDSIKQHGGVKLVSLAQTSPHSEMMRACKCFPQISSMSTLTHSKASSVCCLIFVQNIQKWQTLAPTYNSFTRHNSSHQRTTKQFEENLNLFLQQTYKREKIKNARDKNAQLPHFVFWPRAVESPPYFPHGLVYVCSQKVVRKE